MNVVVNTLVLMAVAFTSSPAVAGNANPRLDLPVTRTVVVPGAKIDVYAISAFTSATGEGKIDFLKRVAVPLADFTKVNGVEGCSNICYSAERTQWAVAFSTVNAHAVCLVNSYCAKGFTNTGEYIHSHPAGETYRVNHADKVFLGAYVKLGNTQRGHGLSFSKDDVLAGPGYLVAEGQLLYQSGPGATESLGPIAVDVVAVQSP